MNAVITLGIDMASQPKGTAACAVTWEADRAAAATPCLGCDDGILSEMIAKSHAVGIDAPFGWPAEFAVAVGAWSFTSWTTQLSERLCFRVTDRFVHEKLGRWPLSGCSQYFQIPGAAWTGGYKDLTLGSGGSRNNRIDDLWKSNGPVIGQRTQNGK